MSKKKVWDNLDKQAHDEGKAIRKLPKPTLQSSKSSGGTAKRISDFRVVVRRQYVKQQRELERYLEDGLLDTKIKEERRKKAIENSGKRTLVIKITKL